MKEKMRVLLDSKMTWASLGAMAGVTFGENVAAAVNAFGLFVMAII